MNNEVIYKDEKSKDIEYSYKTHLKRVSWRDNTQYRTYIFNAFFSSEGSNLGQYKCVFTISKNNGIKYLEQIETDLDSNFYCAAPETWSICKATLIDQDYNIYHRFNFYKQHAKLHNKRLVLALNIKTIINDLEE